MIQAKAELQLALARRDASVMADATRVAWLDWQLKGDKDAAKYFVGADCLLCTNPIWEVAKKNLN